MREQVRGMGACSAASVTEARYGSVTPSLEEKEEQNLVSEMDLEADHYDR